MTAMLKFINTLYHQYYLFFKNILKEDDIPALNATLFLCALETFFVSVLVQAIIVTFFCEIIPRYIVITIGIGLLLLNLYFYYFKKYKDEVISGNIAKYSVPVSRLVAILTPLLVWFFIMVTVFYSKHVLMDCGYDGMWDAD